VAAGLLVLGAAGAGCGASPVGPTPIIPDLPPVVTPDPDPTPPAPPPPPTLGFLKLVAFGDSLTEGVTSLATAPLLLVPSQAYPSKLQGKLLARYTAQAIAVANDGKAGEWAVDGVRRLSGVVQSRHPELVLLMEGVNDLNNLGEPGISSAANAMEDMVRMCRYQGIAVMLAGIPPQRPGGSKAWSASLVGRYNERLRAVALAKGAEFVDIAAGFGGDLSLLGSDGLHPTEAGYERIAQTFYDRIVAVYEQKPSAAVLAAGR
jgi:lysophospholipase L1-like esterase